MCCLRLGFVGAALVFEAAVAHLGAATVERSVSTSRQFIVYGGDIRLRSAICDLAEQTKQRLLHLTESSDGWKTPIVINAQPPQANLPEAPPAQLRISQTGGGLKLQLDLTIGSDVAAAAVQQQVLRALLLELIYRDQADLPAGSVYAEPPPWLSEGITTLELQHDRSGVYDRLSPAIAANKILPLSDLLHQRPELLDTPSRALYRAYTAALVQLITSSADGRKQLARFVRDLRNAPNDPVADFAAHFPALRDADGSAEAAWKNGVTALVTNSRYRLLGIAESDDALEHLAIVTVVDGSKAPKSYKLDELPRVARTAAISMALQRLSQELLFLELRANPLYRPIVHEYRELAALLAGGQTKQVGERITRINAQRGELKSRLVKIDDYMNWFEATQSRTQTGAFAAYLKAADSAENQRRRRDPISVYLDTFETQLGD
jgi:hypothetical protein